MNLISSLTLLWTSWSLTLALLAIVAMACLSYVTWRRSHYRPSVAAIEGLRLSIVLLVAWMLNQPEWIGPIEPDEKPTIVVCWDDTPSMKTSDVDISPSSPRRVADGESDLEIEAKEGARPASREANNFDRSDDAALHLQTRHEAITPLLEEAAWNPLRERYRVLIEPFSSYLPPANPPFARSDLHTPMLEVMERNQNLKGLVLLTDGDWNYGQPPVEAALKLRLQGVPVVAVPIGSPTRIPDVEILSFEVPTFAVAGKAVRIGWVLENAFPQEQIATLVLRSSLGDQTRKEIRMAPMSRTRDWLAWRPKSVGDLTLTLEIPPQPGERLTDNNRMSAPISIREEKLRVLIVESVPRWEYRFLRNALARDPGIDVSCLLFHPGLSKRGGGSRDYIKHFPDELEALAKFDVVFLGDVGWEEGQLSRKACKLLKGLVEHQAGGLVFLPGIAGRQFSLLETELKALYPVVLDPGKPAGWGSQIPQKFELTEQGRQSLLTRLGDTLDENFQVWDGLPGFQWYAPVVRARAGSQVLAVHRSATNQYGRLPLLATRTLGTGKVLFMGTDGAWRWRKGVEDKYHYRFWGQVVRWMAYQRNMAKGETMRLYYSPDQPQLEQTVIFHANVMHPNGEPVEQGEVTARVVAPSGKTKTIHFQSSQSEASQENWGTYEGRYQSKESGAHRLTLGCKQTETTLEATFYVQGVAVEPKGRPARPEILEEIVRVNNGHLVSLDHLEDIVPLLAALPPSQLAVRRVQWWCHPAMVGLLIFLLSIFWIVRKRAGMI